MGSFFVGCTACSVMLILGDADGPARARRAGWTLSPLGWRCPKHLELLASEIAEAASTALAALDGAEPATADQTTSAAPAVATG
jgi:hypothetical protein